MAGEQELRLSVPIVANFVLIAGLMAYGFRLLAEYHARGRWAKNITALLAGVGVLSLALALLIRPVNAQVIARIAATKASHVFLWVSTGFLMAAIAAFGIIAYWKPLRLLHERKIERDQHSELPNIP